MIYSLIAAIVVVLCLAFLLLREHRISLSIREKREQEQTEIVEARTLISVQKEEIRRVTEESVQRQSALEQLRGEKENLEHEGYRWQVECQHLQRALEEAKQKNQDQAKELQLQFKEIATQIVEERSKTLGVRNEETLRPLREDIERLGKRVEETYSAESRERISLQSTIRELMQQSGTLSTETNALIKALKGDSKVQGDWGEMILENILQSSGLRRGEEYMVQETLRDEQGDVLHPAGERSALRPDVIVRYPNGGAMVIDSKVSLTAYSRYIATEDDEERKHFAQEHLDSVRKHIVELSAKRYPEFITGAPDFVVLFIPNDPAYSLALTQDPALWETAYKKGVVLINGTNLIAVLRMAQDMWQRDRQIKNVEEIVRRASAMYDKFCTYAATLIETEDKMVKATESLRKARGQLSEGRGNFIHQMEQLRELGVKNTKSIPTSLLPPTE